MDKDRIAGSAKKITGGIKEAAGKALGDKKIESEGKTQKVAGKVQNAIGSVKDTVIRQLREQGLITLSGHRVVVHDPEKLRDLAEYDSRYLDQSYGPI